MANCFTRTSKQPKTTHLCTFVDWTSELGKIRDAKACAYVPHKHLWPFPYHKRFRPMPEEINKLVRMKHIDSFCKFDI